MDAINYCCSMFQKADFQWTWVGLRPHREPIRLEKEVMDFQGKKLKVECCGFTIDKLFVCVCSLVCRVVYMPVCDEV